MSLSSPKAALRRPAGQDEDGLSGAVSASRFTARSHPTLEAVGPLWEQFQSGGVATVYQRMDWASAIARHLAGPAKAELVLVEVADSRRGASVMLLPLVRRRSRTHSTIEFLDLGVCDYAAPLVASGTVFGPQEMEAVWAAVRSVLPKADIVHIRHLADKVGGRPNPLTRLHGARRMEMQAFGVALSGDAATVVQRVCGNSTFRDLRKAKRRMAERGAVRFVVPSTAEEIDALFDVLVRQRLDRFRELGRFDLLNLAEVRAFYRDAARLGPSRGPVRLFGIQVGEEWVATAYGLVADGAFHGTLLAMAGQDWRRCSPGLTIISEIMVWAREQGITYLDFTVGDMPYKTGFGVSGRDLFEIVEPLSARGRLIMRLDRAAAEMRRRIARHPKLFDRLRQGIQWYRRVTRRAERPS